MADATSLNEFGTFCILINAFCHIAQIATDECIYLIFNKRYFVLWSLAIGPFWAFGHLNSLQWFA